MLRSSDITTFSACRQRLRDHFDQARETGRPMFVTTNGETDAVILSPSAYDVLVEKVELAESLIVLDRSMLDVAANRGVDLATAAERIAGDLGLEPK